MGHGAENLVLEAVRALQPQPLRRQAAVGLRQRARALGNAILELAVGLVQLLIQNDVVEGDRKPAGKNLDEGTVGFRNGTLRLQQHDDLAPAAGARIKSAAVVGEFVFAALESRFNKLPQVRIERLRSGGSY